MPYKPRGPRDWAPGMKPAIVEGPDGRRYRLRFLRDVKNLEDLPSHPDFRCNAEAAFFDKTPMELYDVFRLRPNKSSRVAFILWFPDSQRGGVASKEHDFSAAWTDAISPLDVLERWAWEEMADEED